MICPSLRSGRTEHCGFLECRTWTEGIIHAWLLTRLDPFKPGSLSPLDVRTLKNKQLLQNSHRHPIYLDSIKGNGRETDVVSRLKCVLHFQLVLWLTEHPRRSGWTFWRTSRFHVQRRVSRPQPSHGCTADRNLSWKETSDRGNLVHSWLRVKETIV